MSVRNLSHLNGVNEEVLETQELQWRRPEVLYLHQLLHFIE